MLIMNLWKAQELKAQETTETQFVSTVTEIAVKMVNSFCPFPPQIFATINCSTS